MLKEGDIVRIVEVAQRQPKSWIVTLVRDGELSTHLGKIFHNECIGRRYGDQLKKEKKVFILLKPSVRDFLRHFRLKTQILYADDCAIACNLAGLSSGMRVGEAGTGSGALTLFLAHNVHPTGQVFSFDINADYIANAQKNLAITGLSDCITFKLQDIRAPLEVRELDAFFLDFSSPYEAIDNIAPSLKSSGHLICFVPNWGQVEETVAQIRKSPYFFHVDTFEITRRNFTVNPERHIMRPVFRDLVYSGILIHAIRINPNQ
ncbi:MAG: methyltransferase domain-containing protein [Candidatus Heimdallarchaeota archaeon]|nr:MAG: methyltransferase domain-containing protein [Candidatus Heimdallarchaeota archaeon]